MDLRSNSVLSAIAAVLTVSACGRAQDMQFPGPSFSAAHNQTPGRFEPRTGFEPAQERTAAFTSGLTPDLETPWVSDAVLWEPVEDTAAVRQADYSLIQPPLAPPDLYVDDVDVGPSREFSGRFTNDPQSFGVGFDFYAAPEFEGGLIIIGRDVAMKIGGCVKADFIYDFGPIDNSDAFDTTSIPVGAPHRTNARYHARQTRLSFDTRWAPPHLRIGVR